MSYILLKNSPCDIIKNILLSKITYRVVCTVLGGIFIYSGWLKLTDLRPFSAVIGAFGLVPVEVRSIAAFLISSSEIIAGAGLILDIKGTLTAMLFMMILFIMVLGYGIQMGFDIDCGCFGNDDPVGAAFHGLRSALVRDLILISLTLYLYIWRRVNSFKPQFYLFCIIKNLYTKRS